MSEPRSENKGGFLRFYDSATYESTLVIAPVFFQDDFVGVDAVFTTETGSVGIWDTVEVNLNTAIGASADAAGGAVDLIIDADSNAEDAVLYMANQRNFDAGSNLNFEAKVNFSTLPTTGVTAVLGVANDHNLDKDSVAAHAWFRLNASGAVVVETDDTTNDNDDVSTGVTVVAGETNVFRIDLSDLSDVKFFINGARVASGTTFDMSNLSAGEELMQPYFSLDKASGIGVGTMSINKVTLWSK